MCSANTRVRMVDERKNIKVSRELFNRLEDAKPPQDTWDQFLTRLLEEAPVKAERVRVEDEQVEEIAQRTLQTMTGKTRRLDPESREEVFEALKETQVERDNYGPPDEPTRSQKDAVYEVAQEIVDELDDEDLGEILDEDEGND